MRIKKIKQEIVVVTKRIKENKHVDNIAKPIQNEERERDKKNSPIVQKT
jgi:hypothetical protein